MDSENCLLCGAEQPPGHVKVYRRGEPAGRVCSSHTLREVILDPQDRLSVEIAIVPVRN